MDFKYGNLYLKYNMDEDIHIGRGIVKVHDIFNPTPEFMLQADLVISDPPYNKSALSSFYTKAGIREKPDSFESFLARYIEVIEEINPKLLCLEIGVPQLDMYTDILKNKYKYIHSVESYYYKNKKNKCLFLFASNEMIPDVVFDMPFFDEENAIAYLCAKLDYNCVADPCMGLGLVAFYANKFGKRFVGTELNKYRLAVCCERVVTNDRGKIN